MKNRKKVRYQTGKPVSAYKPGNLTEAIRAKTLRDLFQKRKD